MRIRRLIRYSVYISGTVVIIIAAYGTLLAYPGRLFAHRYSYKNFVIYSRNPIDDRIRTNLDVVSQRLAKSELDDPTIIHRVFVAGSSGWYGFFNGPYRGAMARNYEFNNSIFVPQLDLTTGNVVHFDGRRAPIAAIFAHEMTHTLSQKRLGLIRSWQTPSWKKEGYAEYIGNPRTEPLIQDLRILDRAASNTISIGDGVAVPKSYFEASILWRYLAEIRKMSFAEIMSDSVVQEKVEQEMRAWAIAQRDKE
jgi:hypothetical protein